MRVDIEERCFGKAIFRHVGEARYARDFLSGRLQVSTLHTFRALEHKAQRDAEEGVFRRKFDYMNPQSPDFGKFSAEASIQIVGSPFVNFFETTVVREFDGYALSFTEEYAPAIMDDTFGSGCVRINDPIKFFEALTFTLRQLVPLSYAAFGYVRYIGREATGFKNIDCPPPLLKPRDGYTEQKELRMCWEPNDKSLVLEKTVVNCPEIIPYCSLATTVADDVPEVVSNR